MLTKYILRPFVFCIIIVVTILSVDYYVDSYAAIRVTYDKIGRVAQNNNYYVGTDIPLSERKAKWAYINIMERKDYIVMGSSRIEMFMSENMGEESFYNIFVSGGSSVRDYLAETYLLYSQAKLPDKILMEISPSIFNVNSGESRWVEWGDNAQYMQELLDGKKPNGKQPSLGIQWKDLFSPSYFQYNYNMQRAGKRVWFESNDYFDNAFYSTIHTDGSIAYSREYQSQYTEEQIIESTEDICNNRSVYCCGDFKELDNDLQDEFERLIQFLIMNGVEVSFYLPPYSPQLYEFISNDADYKIILNVEDYILDFASENSIKVFGSYDPEGSGLTVKDLYDPYHVRLEKIMDTLWER